MKKLKILVGSTLFFNSPHDKDYVYVNEIPANDVDGHEKTEEQLNDTLHFNSKTSIYAYQYDTDVSDNGLNYHINNFRSEHIKFMANYFETKNYKYPNKMPKNLYHVAFNIFALQNGNCKFTQEQIKIAECIYNGEMEADYYWELKQIFDNEINTSEVTK